MRRTILSLTAALTIAAGAMALGMPASSAQTTATYPGTCNVTTSSVDAGSHNITSTFTITLAPTCVFDPGATVTVFVNGQSVGTKTASSSGTVSVQITVTSSNQLSIDDPILVNSQCGANTVVATGPSSVAGSTVTHSASFTVNCPAAAGAATKGTVAFTGDNIARWSAAALVLVAAGFGLVVFSRRRRATPGTSAPA
jgi:hypothetical protein